MERIAPDGLPEAVTEVTAELAAKVLRADGSVEDKGVVSRKIVSTAFLTELTNAMRATGASVTRIQNYKYHAWGTSTASENAGHNDVQSPALPTNAPGTRVTGTQAGSANTYVSVATITAAGTLAITEHCISPDTTSPSYGLDRSLFPAINVNAGDSIQFTYTLTLTGS